MPSQHNETSVHLVSASNAASARAIADHATLSLAEPNAVSSIGVTPPPPTNDIKNAATRGYSDIIAYVSRHHCNRLHVELQPSGPLAVHLFNAFERARCEALGSGRFSGSATNLAALWKSQHQIQTASTRSVTEREFYPIICAVRESLGLPTSDAPVLPLSQQHAVHLQQLAHVLNDQRKFAELSLSLIRQINFSSITSGPDSLQHYDTQNESDPELTADDSPQRDTDDVLSVSLREDENQSNGELAHTIDSHQDDITDVTTNRDAPVSVESDSQGSTTTSTGGDYRIYSRAEDEVVRAASLCTADELATLRELLDQHIHRHARIIGRLSGKLQRVLMAQQTRQWQFNLNEGILDTARLTRVVTDPLSPLTFKQEMDSPFRDTCVTLLVDNSRSMLGKPVAIAAACSDILSQTLERCGISVEILGFTTTELHRGPLHERWQNAGASAGPGRLNGLRHIIYKPNDTSYRRSRLNFGVMLSKEVLKQNIDGESLLWAYNRLQRRGENRKVLIVISDGAPIDTSTMAANRENYLIDHLQQVITGIEHRGDIELLAIGIGHDVTRYYRRAIKIMDVRDLSQSLLTHLTELFTHCQ